MFRIDDKNIKRLERDLVDFQKRALPFATRKTLNDAAFQTMKIARADIRNELILRNKFTEQSIQVEQTRTLSLARQAAAVGSTADYMADQEFGAVKRKGGKQGVSIATSYSAGQSESSKPRTRLPRRPNKMASIQLQRRRRAGKGRKQQNLIAIKQAAETGRKFVYLDLGRRKGIFKVIGGKRRPKIKMVHDLTSEAVTIPRQPWLQPAYLEAARMVPAFYADALRFQLRRFGLFKK